MTEPKIRRKDRKAAVRALQLAKKMLWGGSRKLGQLGKEPPKEIFICHALLAVQLSHRELVNVCCQLCKIIEYRLDGYDSLNTWLDQRHHIRWYGNIPRLQATRHAWVDSLIKEFS